jgi:release factor glutamine methyltransferase
MSADALELAKENAASTGMHERITFVRSDFLELDRNIFGNGFDILVSNPPYVSVSELASLSEDIRGFEPSEALSDGRDGMTFFRKISEMTPVLLKDGGWVFVETGFGQAKAVEKIFAERGGIELLVKKDLSNVERVVRSRFFSEGTG